MTSESSSTENLILQRIELIGKLSQATAEHLRILQAGSGLDFLLMQQPQSQAFKDEKAEAENKIASNQRFINELESELALIDKRIESTLNAEV